MRKLRLVAVRSRSSPAGPVINPCESLLTDCVRVGDMNGKALELQMSAWHGERMGYGMRRNVTSLVGLLVA